MEYMEYKFGKRCTISNLKVKIGDNTIPQVTSFKYLDSIIQNDGKIEGDINHSIQDGWLMWRSVSSVICDKNVPPKLKGEFYCTIIRLAILYGIECWVVKSQQENKLNVIEMMMLRGMTRHTKQDKVRNEYIREKVSIAHIVEKIVESCLRWFVIRNPCKDVTLVRDLESYSTHNPYSTRE